jgi:hypothetical protein
VVDPPSAFVTSAMASFTVDDELVGNRGNDD